MAITSIPNKISEHNAWGFQLIKVREIKRMMPLQVGHLAGLTPNVQGQPACRNHTMLADFFDIFSVTVSLQVPLQKRALPGNIYELSLAVFHVFGDFCFFPFIHGGAKRRQKFSAFLVLFTRRREAPPDLFPGNWNDA